jgi:hypothetical protein
MVKEEVPYRRGVERSDGNSALLRYLICEQITNIRRVDENRVLSQAADIAEVTYIPVDKGMILFSILLMEYVQVVSPGLAVASSERRYQIMPRRQSRTTDSPRSIRCDVA